MSLPPPLLRAYLVPGLELGEDIHDLTNPHSHLHLHFVGREVEAKTLWLGYQRFTARQELSWEGPHQLPLIQAISQVPDTK